jgi:protein-S-isoprenylcysteine O-methyltransferase Ste14
MMRPPIFFGVPGATWVTVLAFWSLFYLWFFSEIWIGWRKRAAPGTNTRDRGSKWFLILSVWVATGVGLGLAMGLPQAAIPFDRNAVFTAGLLLMIAGMGLRWYSIHALGTSFTTEVATRSGQLVVQAGPYRWVRHPSYTGSLVTILGVLLCCLNWASLAAFALALAGYAYRIRIEEEALAESLGDEYRSYMRRTRRLIPRIF